MSNAKLNIAIVDRAVYGRRAPADPAEPFPGDRDRDHLGKIGGQANYLPLPESRGINVLVCEPLDADVLAKKADFVFLALPM